MVHVRYVKRGNKKCGPYYYESYREGNKVKKRYIGNEEQYQVWLKKKNKSPNKLKFFMIGLGVVLLLILALSLMNISQEQGVVGVGKSISDFYSRFTGFVADIGDRTQKEGGKELPSEPEPTPESESELPVDEEEEADVEQPENIGIEERVEKEPVREEPVYESMFSGSGTGTLGDPYQITNCTQLQEMNDSLGANYTLINNINCSNTTTWNGGNGFDPVGVYSSNNPFYGNLDGNGYNITDLYINRTGEDRIGLFEYFKGEVRSLGLFNVNITGSSRVGALFGNSLDAGPIENCFVTGNINGGDYVGGFGGDALAGSPLINNSYANVNVNGTSNIGGIFGFMDGDSNDINIMNTHSIGSITGSGNSIGGLVGHFTNGEIYNCYSMASINGSGDNIGGLVGYSDGDIFSSYAIGNVTGSSRVGGLIGWNTGEIFGLGRINGSYATGNINGSSDRVGGLVGFCEWGYVNNSYATGDVYSFNHTGGLIGYLGDQEVHNSYATGNVNGSGTVGGLVGYMVEADVYYSYSTGDVNGSLEGGLVGYQSGSSRVNNSYYNNHTGNPDVCVALVGGIVECTAIDDNEAYFYDVDNSPMTFWDFINIWDDVFDDYHFPSLQYEEQELPSSINLTSCDNLSVENMLYILQDNITTSTSCFHILADNITLDFNSHNITGDSDQWDVGVNVSGYNNSVIKNGYLYNFSGTGVYLYFTENNSVINMSIMDNNVGILLHYGSRNIVENCLIDNNGPYGIGLEHYDNYNLFINNVITRNNFYGYYSLNSENNTLLNNNIFDNGFSNVDEDSGTARRNYLVYNNSYGEIKWTNSSFLDDLNVNGNLIFPGNISIGNNTAYFNPEGFTGRINSSANVTLNLSGLNIVTPVIIKDGGECSDCSVLDYTNDIIVFNVSSWSNYSVNDSTILISTCQELDKANTDYILQNNISATGTCLNITNDNIVLDGNGFSINGTDIVGEYGIYVEGVSNITIRDFVEINDFDNGIYLLNVNGSLIINNTFSSNDADFFGSMGIYLSANSTDIIVRENTAYDNGNGVGGEELKNSLIEDNDLSMNHAYGFFIDQNSTNNHIKNNNLSLNTEGIGICGLAFGGRYLPCISNIIEGNNLSGNNYGIVINKTGTTNNIILNNNILTSNNYAILVGETDVNQLIYNNSYGEIKWTSSNISAVTDLSFPGNISIGDNLTYFNAGSNDNINSTANISLEGIAGFVSPIVLRDGVECTDCYLFSYDGSTAIFNVSSWSNYSVAEGPNTPPTILSVNISTTNPFTNDTLQNLTSVIGASDTEGDNITYWYSWYKEDILNATTLIEHGLMAYWSFNNDSYDYKDTYDGVPIDANTGNGDGDAPPILNSGGVVGGYYEFDGEDDYINVSHDDRMNFSFINFSVSFWTRPRYIHPDVTAYNMTGIISKGGISWCQRGWVVVHSGISDGSIWSGNGTSFSLSKSDSCSDVYRREVVMPSTDKTSYLLDGNWHHIVYTINRNGMSYVYIDGIEEGSSLFTYWNEPVNSTRPLQIGRRNDHLTSPDEPEAYHNGSIDEVMIFNRTLTAEEVEMLYYGAKYGGYEMGSERTTAEDNWTLGVRGGDYGNTFGDERNSSSLEIQETPNTPPIILSVNISTTNPFTNDTYQNLTSVIGASDTEGDNITYWYSWYKDDRLNATSLITDGLVAYWPFNNDTRDYKSDHHGAAYNGSFLNYSGAIGGAYEFDGVDDFIEVPHDDRLNMDTNNFSVSFWTRPRHINPLGQAYNESGIISKGGVSWCKRGWVIIHDGLQPAPNQWGGNGTSISLSKNDGCFPPGGSRRESLMPSTDKTSYLLDGSWHHIVYSIDRNGTSYVYIDGVEEGSKVFIYGNESINNTLPLNIGRRNDHLDDPEHEVSHHNGSIDEVMIFNRTLTAEEVEMLYYGGLYGGDKMGSDRTQEGDNWTLGVRGGDYGNTFGDERNSSSISILSFVPLSNCGTLNQPNTIYVLQNNITTSGTCFTIADDNITLYLNGYNITGDGSGYGVYVGTGNHYSTIRNGFIYNFNTGISMDNSYSNIIKNIILSQNSNDGIKMNGGTGYNQLINLTANFNSRYGVYITGEIENNWLVNSTVNNNSEFGVYLYETSRNKILNNYIFGNRHNGIRLRWYSNHNRIIENIIERNGLNGNRDGLQLKENPTNNTISENIIRYNYDDGINLEEGSNNNLVYNNTIIGNGIAGANYGTGIQIQFDGGASTRNVVSSNNISNNNDDGIKIDGDAEDYNNITYNIIVANGNCTGGVKSNGDGIAVDGGDYNNIWHNVIRESCDDGIELDNSAYSNTIINNTFNDNLGDGVHIEVSSNNNLLENNTIEDNGDEGIQVETNADYNVINFNFVNNNQDHGIIVKLDANYNNITNNMVNGSGRNPDDTGDGINIKTNFNYLYNNTVSYGSDDGIKLNFANYTSVVNNTLRGNEDKSVHLITASYNNITNNYAEYNSHGYVVQDNSTNNTFIDNIAINNSQQGFYIRSDLDTGNSFNNSYACCNYGSYDIYDKDASIFSNSTCDSYNNGNCDDVCPIVCSSGCQIDISSSTILDEDYNCFTDGFIITADDIVFDCNGSSIRGTNQDHAGVLVEGRTNVTVKNCYISNFEKGIYYNNTGNSFILNNELDENKKGFRFGFGLGNIAINNSMRYNDDGIEFESSSNNMIINNTLNENEDEGIQVELMSNNNSFYNNEIRNSLDKGLKIELGSENNSIANNDFSGNFIDLMIEPDSVKEINITNISFSFRESYASILWNNISFNYTDFRDFVIINFNYIFLNSTELDFLNNSARIEMFSTNALGYIDRFPLRNGEACLGTICTEVFDADTYIFDVTQFTNYTVGGTPPTSGGDGGPSEPPCVPDCSCAEDTCEGDTCPDGCGGVCPGTEICCIPFCVGRECGGDGCGGSCGTCDSDENCEGGICVSEEEEEEEIEVPQNLYQRGDDDCKSDFVCGEWEECKGEYNIYDIILGRPVIGTKTRLCIDENECLANFIESRECSLREQVEVKRKKWCGDDYIEVIDITGRTIARLKRQEGEAYLGVSLNLIGGGYCSHCFNNILDYNEEGIDCGGECPECIEELETPKFNFIRYSNYFWIFLILMIIALILFLLSIIWLIIPEKRGLPSGNSFIKQYKRWKRQGYDVSVLKEDIKKLSKSTKRKI